MKIKVTRKDGSPIIGRKKSLTFTISNDLEQLSKASEKKYCINDIDRRTKNIVHLSDGSIKYDFNKYNSYIEAIYADYIDCRTDEQLKESISLCFADSLDQKIMFKKLKLQFLSALSQHGQVKEYERIYSTIP